ALERLVEKDVSQRRAGGLICVSLSYPRNIRAADHTAMHQIQHYLGDCWTLAGKECFAYADP
ncbi:hypothetical protein E4U13_008261, partial [Claviceps humidiphila]